MGTWLITHPVFLAHDTGPGHPENSDRLRAVLAALRSEAFHFLEWHEAESATPDQLARVHSPAYVEETLAFVPSEGFRALDADTVISPASGEAALRAAGALCQGVDAVMSGWARHVFCAVRPPGHHAESDHAMGFCLFNNVAVGAAHAHRAHGVERIAVVDFDVHHGNGTQHMLGGRPGYLYLSTHQAPLFPGTGNRDENREGAIVNAPLPAGSGSEAFRERVREELLPALEAFRPQLLMISAGFDAHAADPLAMLDLDDDDYGWITEQLVAVADRHCDGRIVSTLEGGYDLNALGRGVARHVAALGDC